MWFHVINCSMSTDTLIAEWVVQICLGTFGKEFFIPERDTS